MAYVEDEELGVLVRLMYRIPLVTGPIETAEREYPETTWSVDAAEDISFQFDDVVLKDSTVLRADAVATVALLLVPTVGPEEPIFAMADDRLLKSEVRAVDRLLKPPVTSPVRVLTDV